MEYRIRVIIRLTLLLTGIGFIFLGVLREEHVVILRKAIMICLECIGLG